MHRKALGRGLEALIPGAAVMDPAESKSDSVSMLSLEDVRPNPFQPRTRFDPQALEELSSSIKSTGVLQPVLVRKHAQGGYELVAGERRLKAAGMAGLDAIPAIVREVGDREMMELALVENLQREDLNPIDEAKAYQALVSKVGLTHDQVSERVGKQRSSVTNSLRLLGLPVEVQEMVSRGTLSAGHGDGALRTGQGFLGPSHRGSRGQEAAAPSLALCPGEAVGLHRVGDQASTEILDPGSDSCRAQRRDHRIRVLRLGGPRAASRGLGRRFLTLRNGLWHNALVLT